VLETTNVNGAAVNETDAIAELAGNCWLAGMTLFEAVNFAQENLTPGNYAGLRFFIIAFNHFGKAPLPEAIAEVGRGWDVRHVERRDR
jgi:hypothetical protein